MRAPGCDAVLFDWSGTLGRSGERDVFVRTGTRGWLPGVREALRRFSERNPRVVLGVVTNTGRSARDMREGLRRAGLDGSFPVVVSSADVRSEKPDELIYAAAWRMLRKQVPRLRRRDRVLHVGDNYYADVWGAKAFGFRAGLVAKNGEPDWAFRLASLMGVQDVETCNVPELLEML